MNFPPPSASVFGGQHIRMLEATHARIPPSAPMMPGRPPAKPIIEKMELPHVCAAHEGVELADAYAVNVQCMRKTELPHDCSRAQRCVRPSIGGAPACAAPTYVRGWRTRQSRRRRSTWPYSPPWADPRCLCTSWAAGVCVLGIGQACNRQRRTSPPRLEQLIEGQTAGPTI